MLYCRKSIQGRGRLQLSKVNDPHRLNLGICLALAQMYENPHVTLEMALFSLFMRSTDNFTPGVQKKLGVWCEESMSAGQVIAMTSGNEYSKLSRSSTRRALASWSTLRW